MNLSFLAQLSSLIDTALQLQASDASIDLSSFTGVTSVARLNNNDKKLLDALKSVNDMDANLRDWRSNRTLLHGY